MNGLPRTIVTPTAVPARIPEQKLWDYITRKRVDLAVQYLQGSELPVLAVAEKCGFGSISNFNRCFREVTGTSPSACRRAKKIRYSPEAKKTVDSLGIL